MRTELDEFEDEEAEVEVVMLHIIDDDEVDDNTVAVFLETIINEVTDANEYLYLDTHLLVDTMYLVELSMNVIDTVFTALLLVVL